MAMSTDQYPEIRGEESGLVPPQSAVKPEWPKKIRTLTAAELDRLTIDAEGRFLWDNRPVNYVAPEAPKPPHLADALDRSAMEMLDRAALELSDRRPADGSATHQQPADALGPTVYHPVQEIRPADEIRPIEHAAPMSEVAQPYAESYPTQQPYPAQSYAAQPYDAAQPAADQYAQYTSVAPVTADGQLVAQPGAYAQPVLADKMRISLSFWQSLGAILLVLGVLIAAAGVAASGFAEAHSWSCRIGLTKMYCPVPPPPPPAPPPRADIPA
jgi:hypothetical protein